MVFHNVTSCEDQTQKKTIVKTYFLIFFGKNIDLSYNTTRYSYSEKKNQQYIKTTSDK